MVSEVKKLHIIEAVLKVKSEATLNALENILKKSKTTETPAKTAGIEEFSGIWTNEEADEIEKIISESCETIHPDDWK